MEISCNLSKYPSLKRRNFIFEVYFKFAILIVISISNWSNCRLWNHNLSHPFNFRKLFKKKKFVWSKRVYCTWEYIYTVHVKFQSTHFFYTLFMQFATRFSVEYKYILDGYKWCVYENHQNRDAETEREPRHCGHQALTHLENPVDISILHIPYLLLLLLL